MNTVMTKFQTQNPQHVEWLKELFSSMRKSTMNAKENSLYETMNANPFGVAFNQKEFLNLPEIHFGLAMKYAEAVLNGTAYIPPGGSPEAQQTGPFGSIL